MNKNRLLAIRTDVSPEIGFGHFMRTLALSQAWLDNQGSVVYLMAQSVPSALRLLERERLRSISVAPVPGSEEDAARTVLTARELKAEWLVMDGYAFKAEYQQTVARAGLNSLVVDDYLSSERYFTNLILNQNLHAKEEDYAKKEPYSQCLLGPRYALLRREFLSSASMAREIPVKARKLLITFGGSDPVDETSKVLRGIALLDSRTYEARVVVGLANPRRQRIRDEAAASGTNVTVVSEVSDISGLVSWADVVVSGAGSSCWEFCFLGCPMILVTIARNQERIASSLHKWGAALSLGWYEDVSVKALAEQIDGLMSNQSLRESFSYLARTLVDGLGASRVARAISSYSAMVPRSMSCAS